MSQCHKLAGIERGTIEYRNTFQKLSQYPQAEVLRVPVTIDVHWKDFKLYCKFLDLKAQAPDLGTFTIDRRNRKSIRYYYRVIKTLIKKGWASRVNGIVTLRSYPHVWKLMGIERVRIRGILKYRYWKIPVAGLSDERKTYLKEIERAIRTLMSKRRRGQIRFALKERGFNQDRATFSGKSASILFGYRSPYSGSKLRKDYFEIIPQTPEQAKPYFHKGRGRWEEPTKEIAL